MNPVFRKLQVSVSQHALMLNRSLPICRSTPSIRHPVWCAASANDRLYRSMPTHGIGRWRNFLPKQAPKKKKDKQQMKQIVAATGTAHGTLNVAVSGYDMTVVEHYSQFIHNLCNRLGVKVAERRVPPCPVPRRPYALPTEATEVLLVQEQGAKTYVDAVLKTHRRVVQVKPRPPPPLEREASGPVPSAGRSVLPSLCVQVSSLDSTLCPVFMDVVLKNQPEGVQLSVKEHTEADYQARFKARPELEGLIAQMNQ
ncbi:unnamed protein product [Menidia menidia]|uniref:(Atlantic silverside) hypothetical protein n=1 Tax=Menidia menidia TaxID=238744 RepID=A0A8S4BGQ5_9TELE|nr:unnamed protein product [Menidia menidia]